MVAEEKFPISEQRYTTGKLLDGTECQILLDTRASKSFMSNHTTYAVNHFIHYPNSLQKLKESK